MESTCPELLVPVEMTSVTMAVCHKPLSSKTLTYIVQTLIQTDFPGPDLSTYSIISEFYMKFDHELET